MRLQNCQTQNENEANGASLQSQCRSLLLGGRCGTSSSSSESDIFIGPESQIIPTLYNNMCQHPYRPGCDMTPLAYNDSQLAVPVATYPDATDFGPQGICVDEYDSGNFMDNLRTPVKMAPVSCKTTPNACIEFPSFVGTTMHDAGFHTRHSFTPAHFYGNPESWTGSELTEDFALGYRHCSGDTAEMTPRHGSPDANMAHWELDCWNGSGRTSTCSFADTNQSSVQGVTCSQQSVSQTPPTSQKNGNVWYGTVLLERMSM